MKRTPDTASSPGACTAKPCRAPAPTLPAGPAQGLVGARRGERVEGRDTGRRADRVAVQRVRRPHDLGLRPAARVEHRHHVGATGDRGERIAAADRLAVAGEVGHHAVGLLRAAVRDPEAGDDLVEDQHDAVPRGDLAQRLVAAVEDGAHVAP
ncbi:MAG TPA: hypothetical protein PKC20_08425, partial [Burkholderiaceae bacterium]|nr:hypothetical protein [Burkholderiaceae bacterium]